MPGITGKNCETNINECDSNPCSKYGTCNDGVSRIYYLPLGKIPQSEKKCREPFNEPISFVRYYRWELIHVNANQVSKAYNVRKKLMNVISMFAHIVD